MKPLRVVVVDDSVLIRRLLTDLLQRDPEIQVVGQAPDGREAIRLVQELRPDLITMDVQMPHLDGLAATEHLMAYQPTPILVVTSLDPAETDITFRMLAAGALEVMEKPRSSSAQELDQIGRELIRRVRTLARVKVVTHLRGRRRPSQPATQQPQPKPVPMINPEIAHDRFPIIVIGASTGGPRVIARILADLPATFTGSVIIVQHIAAGFSAVMADWLAGQCHLPVRVATHQEALKPGSVLVAPDQLEMRLRTDGRIALLNGARRFQLPEIDTVMMDAAIFGPRVIGVLLTGMGRDGANGMLAIHRSGGQTLIQDETSCTIFGMPRAALELNAVDESLPPDQIGARLVDLVSTMARHR